MRPAPWVLMFLCAACTGEGGGLFADDDADDDGFVLGEDCNDANAAIHPDAGEVCDAADVDEDCNGLADNADPGAAGAVGVWRDADADGYGDPDSPASRCELGEGWSSQDGDCDDFDASANPGAAEVCDGADVDEDCDGLADDADPSPAGRTAWYLDADGDGFGDGAQAQDACDLPAGHVASGDDCDDADAEIHPGAQETWHDGIDADCSGTSDDDRDGDGWDGRGGGDCDDFSSAANPDAAEVWYDGVDQDCDDASDYDQDADGFDAAAYGGDDCDDEDADTWPGAWEDGTADTNCDGVALAAPQALAELDAASVTRTCSVVRLDGADSADPDGGALSYAWELVEQPADALASTDDIVSPDVVEPVFVPLVEGVYTFELVVTNAEGVASWPDQVTVSVTERTSNSAPVANAGADQELAATTVCTRSGSSYTCPACAEATFTLEGSGSTDADDELLDYAWTVVDGDGTLSSSTGGTTSYTLPEQSTARGIERTSDATLQLTVTDCFGVTSTDTVTVTTSCTGT